MKFHLAAAGLALTITGALAGYVYGLKGAGKNAGSYDGPRSCNPEDAPVTKAQRNIVWRVMNDGPAAVPDSPEQTIGEMLTDILVAFGTDQRNMGLIQYLKKSAAYFTPEDLQNITAKVENGSSHDMLTILRSIHAADTRANRLIQSILADDARLKLLQDGKPIPLEP